MCDLSAIPVVDVDNRNLKAVWPTLLMAVKNAAFIAIDCELSGLGDRRKLNARSVEDRYNTICSVARTRAVVSLGVSCYQYQPAASPSPAEPASASPASKHHAYVVQTFNLLLFCDESFVSDPVSLRFLVGHGFNFNKQYAYGVNYYRGPDKNAMDHIRSPLRQLFAQLVACARPLVLHNGLVDLIFLYQNFYTGLPKDLATFVADVHELFPSGVYDTKYIVEFKARYQASFLEYCFKKSQRNNGERVGNGRHVEVFFLKYSATDTVTYMQGQSRPPVTERHDSMCKQFASFGFCHKGDACPESHNVDWILDNEQAVTSHKRDKRNRKRKREQERAAKNACNGSDGNQTAGDNDFSAMEDVDIKKQDGRSDQDDENHPDSDSDVDGDESMDGSFSIDSKDSSSDADITHSVQDKCRIDSAADANIPTDTNSVCTRKSGGHRAGFDAFMTGYIFAYFVTQYGVPSMSCGALSFHDFDMSDYKGKLALNGKDLPLTIMKSSYSKSSKEHKEKLQKINLMKNACA